MVAKLTKEIRNLQNVSPKA